MLPCARCLTLLCLGFLTCKKGDNNSTWRLSHLGDYNNAEKGLTHCLERDKVLPKSTCLTSGPQYPNTPPSHLTLIFFSFFFLFVVNFVIHWNETAMGLHVFPIPIPPPTSLSTLSP